MIHATPNSKLHRPITEFQAGESWPELLRKLYDEAALAYDAGAYTAATMMARKALVGCACNLGARIDLDFEGYVEFVANDVIVFPRARATIDKLRGIGSDSNHRIWIVSQRQAKQAMTIVRNLLNAIYTLTTE